MQKHPSINGRERNDEDDDERGDESIVVLVLNIRFVTFLGLSLFVMPTSLAVDILHMTGLVL